VHSPIRLSRFEADLGAIEGDTEKVERALGGFEGVGSLENHSLRMILPSRNDTTDQWSISRALSSSFHLSSSLIRGSKLLQGIRRRSAMEARRDE
jgi:hypothetical protein